jgi:MinD-like ATPase involved in chromosome partitioning or flagellar assembly
MSLVNIAAHLAETGRRVLIVDFDLEAPGIRTYQSMGNPAGQSNGLVDYIKQYLDTSVVPDLPEFVYEPSLNIGGSGELWVMPSGREDALYSSRLSSVDWADLYNRREGYLLFEELKAQWKKYLNPDYVLIDSRTGHTEVGGICTRQLADAVVALFVPTEQNLGGLQKVIADVKAESPKKQIRIHYVMSNVPDLDDEYDVLRQRLTLFKEGLGFSELSATIHHYPSLQLMEQPIFTIGRPTSRLAKEYVTLADAIIRSNLRDREGALSRLRDASVSLSGSELDLIRSEYAKDGDVLYELAKAHVRSGRVDEALALLNAAAKNGCNAGDLYVIRAGLNYRRTDNSEVAEDLLKSLHFTMPSEAVNQAVRLLSEIHPEGLRDLAESIAFDSLNLRARIAIAKELAMDARTVKLGERLLRPLLGKAQEAPELLVDLAKWFPLVLIAAGLPGEALMMLKLTREQVARPNVPDAFNLAMASWAATREISKELFKEVLDAAVLDPNPALRTSPNFNQALAMSHWAAGDLRKAAEYLSLSRKQIAEYPFPEFSCWRYLKVNSAEFKQDLDAMERMFNGEKLLPSFMPAR